MLLARLAPLGTSNLPGSPRRHARGPPGLRPRVSPSPYRSPARVARARLASAFSLGLSRPPTASLGRYGSR